LIFRIAKIKEKIKLNKREEKLLTYYTQCERIFSHYGEDAQKRQLIQELSELITALTKNDEENITEEMADVLVLLDQFVIANPERDKKIQNMQLYKVERQLKRIQEDV
jgi:NTP pyrophosphatase (non-canonical NTP hydrolase)